MAIDLVVSRVPSLAHRLPLLAALTTPEMARVSPALLLLLALLLICMIMAIGPDRLVTVRNDVVSAFPPLVPVTVSRIPATSIGPPRGKALVLVLSVA